MEYIVKTGATLERAESHDPLTVLDTVALESIVQNNDVALLLERVLAGNSVVVYEGEEINQLSEEAKQSEIESIEFCCKFALNHKMNLYFVRV